MKNDGRSISHEVLETYRFAAIKLKKSGVPINVISNSFNVTERAVYRWLRKSEVEGKKSLKASKATGRQSNLSEDELSELCKFLRKPATELGYSTDLWSGPRIRHLIKYEFGIEYHQKHMPRLLKSLGLELKFPERRALEQDAKEVRLWKTERFPEILKYAKKKRALLFYADESIISLIPYVGKTWAFPNKKPIVRVSGKRGQNIGVTAAVNQQGRMCFELTKEKEKFTTKVFIRFIKKMHRENNNRFIVLIVDGTPTHTAGIVKEFMKENKSWLRLEILPAYSPELNPTEKSWRFIKTKKLSRMIAGKLNWEEKMALCHRWKESGINKSQFCKQQDIALPTFCEWCYRVWPKSSKENASALAPVRMIDNEDTKKPESKIVLELSLSNQTLARLSLPTARIGEVIRELCYAATTIR